MGKRLNGTSRNARIERYWALSRLWHGQLSPNEPIKNLPRTMGELGREVQGLATDANHNRQHTLETVSAKLLNKVILNKKCRKTAKPPKNVVGIEDLRHQRDKRDLHNQTMRALAEVNSALAVAATGHGGNK